MKQAKTTRPLKLLVAAVIGGMLLTAGCSADRASVSVTPVPVSITPGKGYFRLLPGQEISYTGGVGASAVASYLSDFLKPPTGFEIKTEEGDNGAIALIINAEKIWEPEEYDLSVSKNRVIITAGTSDGLFRGIQTLRQLFPEEIESDTKVESVKWKVPCVTINDYPRFEWRGLMLDVSRHFFDIEFVKRYIDLIAMHKMNVFHWHLVDDQGWRIEIKKYPRLTEVGAWRVNKEDKPWSGRELQQPGEIADFGGFYTQEQIREVVAYAAERHITVVPEIEMPAHVSSALAAYPEYSCTGGPFTVPTGGVWPITDIYCAGKEETFTFLEDILTEVMELFPSEYIHIGGDEANKKEWKKCPDCQARIRKEGLRDEAELQSYFIKRIERFISSKGRKLIGWDEILEGGIAPGAAVMSWRGFSGGIEAAKSGHKVVMTPMSHCYFNFYQGEPAHEPQAYRGYIALRSVYSFEPVPQELTPEEAEYVIGAQANLWTEFVLTPSSAEYQVLPRITALSEVLWSPAEKRDWDEFHNRLSLMKNRFGIMGLNYSNGSYRIEILTSADTIKNAVTVTLSGEQPASVIRFTSDGSDPTSSSTGYVSPFTADTTVVIKTAYFTADTLHGLIYTRKLSKLK